MKRFLAFFSPGFSLKPLLLLSILFFCPSTCCFNGSPLLVAAESNVSSIVKERKAVERRLQSLKKQLGEYQAKLKATQKKESRSLKQLENLRKQILVLDGLITENQKYLRELDANIQHLRGELRVNRGNYERVSDAFSRTAISVYMYGRSREEEHLFASGSVNEALARIRYIGFFTSAVHQQVDQLKSAEFKLESSRKALESSYRLKADAVKDQERQLQDLASTKSEKEDVLKKLKKDKKAYSEQLSELQRKRKQLQGRIEALIRAEQKAIAAEEARRRKLREAEQKKNIVAGKPSPPAGRRVPETDSVELLKVSADFDKAYGKLPWPVSEGVVTQQFGKMRDKELKIVMNSNGIDISVPANTPVRAVSGGKVAQIAFLPTFGNIVIIRHPKSYLTVYANLGDLRVTKDELINSSQLIGHSGAVAEGGSVVHFEIWKGNKKQNPEKWLKK